jgi:glycosyltransferase involved in cell wall biosynthesis
MGKTKPENFPKSSSNLKIAIVADNASKKMGGEAILPYHYFRVLHSRNIDVWLIVHERVREELESIFPDFLDHIIFLKDLPIQKWYWNLLGERLPHRLSAILVGYPINLINQFRQKYIVRKLVKKVGINIVHQPAPVSPKLASMIFNTGSGVVIGPMNGGMTYPPGFTNKENSVEKATFKFGRYFSSIVNLIVPGKRLANVLLVANDRTQQALPFTVSSNVIQLVENGVDTSVWKSSKPLFQSEFHIPRFLFIGRLVDWKAVDLLLEAVVRIKHKRAIELRIIGDGIERKRLEEMSKKLGISENVTFLGHKTQEECADELHQATALVLPSLYECGGAVVLEAMYSSRPVIATKWGGPVDYLTDECGILIEPTSKPALITGIANAMSRLSDNPQLCQEMGAAGKQRVIDKFDWERKIDQMLLIYNQVFNENRQPIVQGTRNLDNIRASLSS